MPTGLEVRLPAEMVAASRPLSTVIAGPPTNQGARNMSTQTTDTIQERLAGTWKFIPLHSSANFSVKYLVAHFRGRFEELDASLNDGVLTGSAKVASVSVKDP